MLKSKLCLLSLFVCVSVCRFVCVCVRLIPASWEPELTFDL